MDNNQINKQNKNKPSESELDYFHNIQKRVEKLNNINDFKLKKIGLNHMKYIENRKNKLHVLIRYY